MVLSFVYVILMNGPLKYDTKATDGGGLDLTFCTGVLGEVEGEGLQTRNGSCCEQGVRGIKKGFISGWRCKIILFHQLFLKGWAVFCFCCSDT